MIEEWLVTDKPISYKEFSDLTIEVKTALTARAMKEVKDALKDINKAITSFNVSLLHYKVFKQKWIDILSYSPIFAGSINDLKRTIASYEDVHRNIVYRNRFFVFVFLYFLVYTGATYG